MAEYQELRVRFERAGDAEYRLFVSGSSGEAAGVFRLPYADVEIENLVLKLSRPRSAVRRVDSSDLELVRSFGGGLFDALFSGRVRDVYRSSLAAARNEGCGLRISLALTGTPELMQLPWELLYDDPAFLSISTWTPVVRYLDLSTNRRPLKVDPPLRILGMVSAPSDVVELDVTQERAKLEESLAELTGRGIVEIHWLEEATLQCLQRQLRRDEYHIFHYIGHGGFDRASDDGVLALEDGTGRSRLVSGMELGTILADETTLRLAVLNACEGARSSVSDPFSGVATSLVRREIPAVVAMQLEITDRAAITFAGEFYTALADGYAVDAALAEARKAIFADDNEVEWATPVLFMRVPDGRIFDVAAPAVTTTTIAVEPIPVELTPPVDDTTEVRAPAGAAAATVLSGRDAPPPPALETPPPPLDDSPPGTTVRAPAVSSVAARTVPIAILCIFLLLVGVFYPWDRGSRGAHSWWSPHFGNAVPDGTARWYTAASPLMLVLIAAVSTVLVRRGRGRLAAGLILACGLAATAKYSGLLWRIAHTTPVRSSSVIVFLLVLLSALALVVVGGEIARTSEARPADPDRGAQATAVPVFLFLGLVVGSALIVIGCLVPFNTGGTSGSARKILPNEGSQALDPLLVGLAIGVLAALLILRYLSPLLTAAIALALGLESATLWLRYVGIPAVEPADVASPGLGGILGLAGAVLVALTAGVSLVRSGQARKAGLARVAAGAQAAG